MVLHILENVEIQDIYSNSLTSTINKIINNPKINTIQLQLLTCRRAPLVLRRDRPLDLHLHAHHLSTGTQVC